MHPESLDIVHSLHVYMKEYLLVVQVCTVDLIILLWSCLVNNDQIPPDKGIAALFLVLRNVEELKLKKLKHITGKGLQSISSKTLLSVNLRESSSFTDAGVKALVQNCPNIEELNLSELHKLTDNAIIAAAESLKGSLVSLP